jgi:hypothetical protein
MSWIPEAFNPVPMGEGWPECRYYVPWLFANECHAACPYCMIGPEPTKWMPRSWSDVQAIGAWEQFHDDHGPAVLLFGGREPGHMLPLIGAILRRHYGTVVTNLTFEPQVLYRTCDPTRMVLNPSFHARLWDKDIEPFLAKILNLRAHGYKVPVVSMACWPPDFVRIPGWKAEAESVGVRANVHPLYNTFYQGVHLPEGYTDAERAAMDEWIGVEYEDRLAPAKVRRVACAAGHAAGAVSADGRFVRCVQMLEPMGDFMGGEHVKFWDEPRPCDVEHCWCTNMQAYHITEEI